ncbi:hypothetical protein [Methylomicrobium sp. Wu6]|uniref:hypothetical protein n=1 Tax=Methylomicrobium sp. Wu6 TaxID=3107928 RepID=UPI002DD675F0|nr:hypothetical protein [Methylomicrobium sp. Wu6]MEC4749142.1 hypothetical protein [Methylomicrobium sp. Wu6]
MKTRIIKFTSFIAILLAAQTATAYEDEKTEVLCKDPKFTDFTLKEYSEPDKFEVPPESAFEFKVSAWSNPSTIRLTGKNEKIPFTVESNSSFHKVKAKLPASLTGKFVRINAAVKAVLGCEEKKGWLIKVAEGAPAASAAPAADASAPEVNAPAVPATPEKSAPAAATEPAKPAAPAPQ